MVDAVESRVGAIDLLVNSAGAAQRTPPRELDAARWHAALDAKFFSYIHVIDPVIERMGRRGRGDNPIDGRLWWAMSNLGKKTQRTRICMLDGAIWACRYFCAALNKSAQPHVAEQTELPAVFRLPGADV